MALPHLFAFDFRLPRLRVMCLLFLEDVHARVCTHLHVKLRYLCASVRGVGNADIDLLIPKHLQYKILIEHKSFSAEKERSALPTPP